MSKRMSKLPQKSGGPKSVAGKLTASMNAAKHGILSPKPVVSHFESETGWKTHRQSILDALAPADGIEQALAERVALNSWRLNRVIVYETESINALQDSIVDEMRKNKRLYPTLSSDEPDPDAVQEVEKRRAIYEDVCALFDAESSHHISAPGLSWLYEQAPYYAPLAAAFQENPNLDEGEVELELSQIADELEAALDKHLEAESAEDRGYPAVPEMRASIGWLADEAGVKDEGEKTNLECVLEMMSAAALNDLKRAEGRAGEFAKEVASKRRERILPNEDQLQKISRYEAHISRELYRALHELEALQTRRVGGVSPMARVDVNAGDLG